MPRVLLLSTTTGYQTRAFGEAAERLGVTLAFATDRCHVLDDPWRDEAIPIRFHREKTSARTILESARARPIDGVLVVGDRPTVIAAHVTQGLGLPGHPPSAVAIARNKRLTRERLRAAGLPVPWFVPSRIDVEPESLLPSLQFPCVVKPVSLSASRGVMRADDDRQFLEAFERLRVLLRSPEIRSERSAAHDTMVVEGFIEGREYALEGLLEHGRLRTLAIFDKPDPLDGPFFEETIYVTPSRAPTGAQRAIEAAIAHAAAAIGLLHGPVHAECRVNARGVYVLEIAARPIGGLCARALRFSRAGGQDSSAGAPGAPGTEDTVETIGLEELLLRHALGESAGPWTRDARASGVMMIPIPRRGIYRGVEGEDEAREVAGVDDVRVTAKPDQLIVPLPEGASYLGFIFARGDTPEAVERALRDAHARLRFLIASELTVFPTVG